MLEMAAWKTVFGAAGVLALLGIPVVLWMRHRALRRARDSAQEWGGVWEGRPEGGTPAGWEDVSSRFIDDFIPDVDEERQEAAQSGSVREAAADPPESLDDVEEGVRVIEEERREVPGEDEVLPPEAEGEALSEDEEEPALPSDKASAPGQKAPWWEGLSAPLDAERPHKADELPAAAWTSRPVHRRKSTAKRGSRMRSTMRRFWRPPKRPRA